MAKKVDPLKAKEAKRKKLAIGLAIAFVLVLAYQGPKTLKMLKGPQPVAAAEAIETPAGTPTPATTPAASAPAVPTTNPTGAGSQPAALANSDLPVAAGVGQLLSFEQFASKDPFQQQVDPDAPATAETDGNDPAAPAPSTPATDPASPAGGSGSTANPPASAGGGGMDGSAGSSGDPAVPAQAPAASTTISVNGTVETVAVGTPFPADQPTFELISLGADGKSVQIGVAGGSLAGGEATVKLRVGKPLTLQNTADGSRYKLELLTVQGAVPAASKG